MQPIHDYTSMGFFSPTSSGRVCYIWVCVSNCCTGHNNDHHDYENILTTHHDVKITLEMFFGCLLQKKDNCLTFVCVCIHDFVQV